MGRALKQCYKEAGASGQTAAQTHRFWSGLIMRPELTVCGEGRGREKQVAQRRAVGLRLLGREPSTIGGGMTVSLGPTLPLSVAFGSSIPCEVSLYKQLCLYGQDDGFSGCTPVCREYVSRKGGQRHRLFPVASGRILESKAAVQCCGTGAGKTVEGTCQRTRTARYASRRGRR